MLDLGWPCHPTQRGWALQGERLPCALPPKQAPDPHLVLCVDLRSSVKQLFEDVQVSSPAGPEHRRPAQLQHRRQGALTHRLAKQMSCHLHC